MYRRLSLSVTGLLIAWTMAGPGTAEGAAQTVVPVHEEPRHRLVHEGDGFQVLDIAFQPGDTTLFHRHDRPIAYVEIDATVVNQQRLGGAWGRVAEGATPPVRPPGRVTWNGRYAEDPVAHRVTAIGPGPFRLIGVVNLGAGRPVARSGPLGPLEVDAGSRYFSRVRREMDGGTALEWLANDGPVVVVLASDGDVAIEGDSGTSGASERLRAPGSFAVLLPHTAVRIRNLGSRPAVLSFVEVR